MLGLDELMNRLWKDYSAMNKQAESIHRALEARGETVVNDHVAFRTFNLPSIDIKAMAAPFVKLGKHLRDRLLIAGERGQRGVLADRRGVRG